MASSMHALEVASGRVTHEPCKASRDCYCWATHYIAWDQDSREGVRRRMRKPVCLKHAKEYAATHGIALP